MKYLLLLVLLGACSSDIQPLCRLLCKDGECKCIKHDWDDPDPDSSHVPE